MPLAAYIVNCSSQFRDRIDALARERGLSSSDLALAFLTVIPADQLDQLPDPGQPAAEDRDDIELKSGPRAGRVLRRKPRLQLRLPPRLSHARIRRALDLSLRVSEGSMVIQARKRDPSASGASKPDPTEFEARYQDRERQGQAMEELRAAVRAVSFEILPAGIDSVADARYVLGFPPSLRLTSKLVKARFRTLSHIYHPDRPTGDNARMAQLIEAMRFLEIRLATGLA